MITLPEALGDFASTSVREITEKARRKMALAEIGQGNGLIIPIF
jgi:hypothetical protein